MIVEELSKTRIDGKPKREPSEYNKFIGACVKGKTGDISIRMKSCAGEWRSKHI